MTGKRPETRLSLIVILVFGVVASKGVDIVNQALASMESAGPGLDASGVRLTARTDAAAPFLARKLTLETIGPAEDAVTAVLRIWPLAGIYWVRLAEIRAASGADLQSVIEAYRLSVLAAPFDGHMMLARQVLGVQLWDVLSADDRRTVITDLVRVWNERPAALTDQLRAATQALSPDGRKAMRAGLISRATIQDRQLAEIGL